MLDQYDMISNKIQMIFFICCDLGLPVFSSQKHDEWNCIEIKYLLSETSKEFCADLIVESRSVFWSFCICRG